MVSTTFQWVRLPAPAGGIFKLITVCIYTATDAHVCIIGKCVDCVLTIWIGYSDIPDIIRRDGLLMCCVPGQIVVSKYGLYY